jgi:hypothetical protein
MDNYLKRIETKVLDGQLINFDEAMQLLQVEELEDLFAAANRVCKKFNGRKVNLCTIMNVKSGKCAENCKYCAQSGHYRTEAAEYPLVNILRKNGYHAGYFKPVSSGGVRHHGRIISYDARFVKAVSGLDENDDLINPFRFVTPVSPHLAAVIEQKPIDRAVIQINYAILKNKYDYLITEGCGGWAVPVNP